MKIVLTSQSPFKIEALEKALIATGIEAEIISIDTEAATGPSSQGIRVIPVKAQSEVSEQPVGNETLRGAENRIVSARRLVPDADYYISIENGIFLTGERYIDKGIVFIQSHDSDIEIMSQSRGVEFPKEHVEEAIRRGLAENTVGQIMAEKGVVQDHRDPHIDLTDPPKSRVEFLVEALIEALRQLPPPAQTPGSSTVLGAAAQKKRNLS